MIFIHPGMAKSATTSLQHLVFARHPEITYLGLPAADPGAQAAIRGICRADSLYYDGDTVRQSLKKLLPANRGTTLLSYENFTLYESKDKGVIAARLHELFPGARVFFTIRRQQDVVGAWYLQKRQKYLRNGHFLDFTEWWEMKTDLPHRSIPDDLRYHDIVAHYAGLFGTDAVRVFLYEQPRDDPSGFCQALSDFLGINAMVFERLLSEGYENPTVPARLVALGRTVLPAFPKRFARKIAKRLISRGGAPARVEIGRDAEAVVRELCVKGNRQLASDFDLPLERHGYFVGPAHPSP